MKKILETLKLKWAEYLLEVLVIMFGILGAFMLNNWNDNRLERAREQTILSSLLVDFNQTQARIQSSITFKADQRDRTIEYLEFLGPGIRVSEDTLISKLWRLTAYNTLNIVDGTLGSLLSSERIDIIKDKELKAKLTSYPATYDIYKEHEEEYEAYIKRIRKFGGRHFSFAKTAKPLEGKANDYPVNLDKWQEDLEHHNDVTGLHLELIWYVLPSMERLNKENKEIIDLINQNIR